MNSVCLDTNVVIAFLKAGPLSKSEFIDYDHICLPFVVMGELLYGAHNSTRAISNLLHYKSFFAQCETLHSNDLVAEHYAEIRSDLKKRGKPIPENDIWIAAVAMAHDMPLLSLDKHLQLIPGLKLEIPRQ